VVDVADILLISLNAMRGTWNVGMRFPVTVIDPRRLPGLLCRIFIVISLS